MSDCTFHTLRDYLDIWSPRINTSHVPHRAVREGEGDSDAQSIRWTACERYRLCESEGLGRTLRLPPLCHESTARCCLPLLRRWTHSPSPKVDSAAQLCRRK